MLATLGATRRLRLAVFAGQLLLAAGAAALLGALAGGMAQMWLAARLAAWAGVTLPAAAWPVWLLAPALGLVLAGIGWFWLVRQYPATRLSSFSFLTPVMGVLAGGLLLGEAMTPAVFGALFLVGAGIWVANRPR